MPVISALRTLLTNPNNKLLGCINLVIKELMKKQIFKLRDLA